MSSPPKVKFRSKIRQRNEIVLQDLANEITLNVKQNKRQNAVSSTSSPRKQESEKQDYVYIQDDIWFNIADHIDPEDVGTFASICTQTANVVSSAIFWKKLSQRFCKDSKKLPNKLRARYENQIGSLRVNVVCALYHLYPLFAQRIKKGYEMATVHGWSCLYNWYSQIGPYWFFCYKLWNKTKPRTPAEYQEIEDWDDEDENGLNVILNRPNNVMENPDEGVCLLLLITMQFIPLPEFHTATILHSSRQLLNSDLRNTNVELTFVAENENSKQGTPTSAINVLYSCCKNKVIPWWHPDFRTVQLFYKASS